MSVCTNGNPPSRPAKTLLTAALLLLATWSITPAQPRRRVARSRAIREINRIAAPETNRPKVIVGVTLIDGRGGEPIRDAVIVVRGGRIAVAGPRRAVPIPSDAEVFDGAGAFVLPGLIDAHFHIDGDDALPALFLAHGVTSLRDPGQWIEAYAAARQSLSAVPRLFLTGPHLDSPPAAYPQDSYIVRDPAEARSAARRFIADGASALKVYFRLSTDLIQAVVQTAHAQGVPVTAHLEIVNAADAVRAGIDGVEHVTSFGTSLLAPRDAEKYRQAVVADNNARREGRYRMWSAVDVNSPRASKLFRLLTERGIFISPTLAIYERRAGDKDTADTHVKAFQNMLAFTNRARQAGVRVVVGSHSSVPHAERGWAYQRELELLVEAGFTPMQAITAGTLENARFFRVASKLGSIERGKLADLVIVDGDPLQDIRAMRRIKRVMLNGNWVAGATR